MHPSRRKPGHGSANTSLTDVRKAVTVSDVSSRHARSSRRSAMSQTAAKLAKNPRDHREWDDGDQHWRDDDRESSFPQFCMTCEKQFVPQDDRFLYCSETCRVHDQNNAAASDVASRGYATYASTSPSYPFYAAAHPEPKDIVPRASPSRPSSMLFAPPAASAGATTTHSSAISALRSLSIHDASPPSPTMTGTYPSSIWPFTRSAAVSPSNSYTRPASRVFSSTYDGLYGADPAAYGTAYGAAYGAAAYGMTAPSAERPLPSRRPGTYSRPKSIELVTPMVGQ